MMNMYITCAFVLDNSTAYPLQVMNETVASVLQMVRPDETRETRLFIRMIDQFFNCLNVKSPRQGILQRKDYRLPYKTANDVGYIIWLPRHNYLLV